MEAIDLSSVKYSKFVEDFLEFGVEADGSVPALEYTQVPFSHPLFIMYSSGTTGALSWWNTDETLRGASDPGQPG